MVVTALYRLKVQSGSENVVAHWPDIATSKSQGEPTTSGKSVLYKQNDLRCVKPERSHFSAKSSTHVLIYQSNFWILPVNGTRYYSALLTVLSPLAIGRVCSKREEGRIQRCEGPSIRNELVRKSKNVFNFSLLLFLQKNRSIPEKQKWAQYVRHDCWAKHQKPDVSSFAVTKLSAQTLATNFPTNGKHLHWSFSSAPSTEIQRSAIPVPLVWQARCRFLFQF